MKIPYIIEEFIDNEWVTREPPHPINERSARAQYEALVCTKRVVQVIYDGKIVFGPSTKS